MGCVSTLRSLPHNLYLPRGRSLNCHRHHRRAVVYRWSRHLPPFRFLDDLPIPSATPAAQSTSPEVKHHFFLPFKSLVQVQHNAMEAEGAIPNTSQTAGNPVAQQVSRRGRTLVLCFDGTAGQYDNDVRTLHFDRFFPRTAVIDATNRTLTS